MLKSEKSTPMLASAWAGAVTGKGVAVLAAVARVTDAVWDAASAADPAGIEDPKEERIDPPLLFPVYQPFSWIILLTFSWIFFSTNTIFCAVA